jgi:hypothetical protein
MGTKIQFIKTGKFDIPFAERIRIFNEQLYRIRYIVLILINILIYIESL